MNKKVYFKYSISILTMSSTIESYSDKQLDEAEINLLKQVERIRKERKSRKKESKSKSSASTSSTSTFSISALWGSGEEKKSEEKSTEKKSVKTKKILLKSSTSAASDEVRPIKATVASIKEVLNYHHVDFPSSAKKDELSEIVRKHNLVRECEKKDANKKAEK